MRNFAAIDFETANGSHSSVCSVGIVIVKNGEITDTYYSLIYPYPEYFTSFTTAVHGLTMDDVEDARTFPKVWEEIEPLIEGLPLVAHDESCLKAAFAAYGMKYPGYKFFCTCRASRRHFGSRLPNHKLDTVAEACGYCLDNHHHALADAEACAKIAIEIL